MYHTKDKTYRLAWIIAVPLMLCLLLSGCSGVKELSIFKEEVPRAKLNLEKPSPLELENLQWIIITSENADEVFRKLEEKGIDPVLWGLTDKDFELLAKNFARIRNQLMITNDLLDKYKEYYESDLNKENEKYTGYIRFYSRQHANEEPFGHNRCRGCRSVGIFWGN